VSYCSTVDVRAITNLTTTDITDSALNSLIDYSTAQLNADIGITMYVKLGDSNYFSGVYDGSNKTFSLKSSPIGDLDNNGTVNTSDIDVWYKANTDETYTKMTSGTATIASIDDHELGIFTFTTAPSLSNDYIVKYVWFPLPYNHFLIKKALCELTAYMAFLRSNLKDVDSYRLGKLAVTKTARHPGLVSFYDRYVMTLGQIRGTTIFRPINWEMSEQMAAELSESLTGAGAGQIPYSSEDPSRY
jgi:hypothetical protein